MSEGNSFNFFYISNTRCKPKNRTKKVSLKHPSLFSGLTAFKFLEGGVLSTQGHRFLKGRRRPPLPPQCSEMRVSRSSDCLGRS